MLKTIIFMIGAVVYSRVYGAQIWVKIFLSRDHEDVFSDLENVGISNDLSEHCDMFDGDNCTSFDGFNDDAFNGLVTLKNLSGCNIVVTGALEKTGIRKYTKNILFNYGAEINKDKCIDNHIESTFTENGTNNDGAVRYISTSGILFVDEKVYWHYRFYMNLPQEL